MNRQKHLYGTDIARIIEQCKGMTPGKALEIGSQWYDAEKPYCPIPCDEKAYQLWQGISKYIMAAMWYAVEHYHPAETEDVPWYEVWGTGWGLTCSAAISAALALFAKDDILPGHFSIMYHPWASVMGYNGE